MKIKSLILGVVSSGLFALSMAVQAADLPMVKVGALKFGTVNWELETIKENGLDKKHGFSLEVTPLGGKGASNVAIQGGAVDVIVSDWIWVARQRHEGRKYTLFPYSLAVGSVMVPADGAKGLEELAGKKLGVAGGPVDKTWLLLRAYSQKTMGKDLADMLEPQFAAPPLLNQLALKGELDGVVNFWHFAAKLQAAGMQSLIDMPTLLKALGVERDIPLIGWVFNEEWAAEHKELVSGFLQASREAKDLLLSSDEEWDKRRPMMKAKDDKVFVALRDAFREGVPRCFGQQEIDASAQTFRILAELGGEELVGTATEMSDGTFWDGFKLDACE